MSTAAISVIFWEQKREEKFAGNFVVFGRFLLPFLVAKNIYKNKLKKFTLDYFDVDFDFRERR
jgi:hypothetical protein